MAPKKDWEKYEKKGDDADKKEAIVPLDEGDIQLLRTYGQGPYASALKRIDQEIKDAEKRVNEKMGVKESHTGLAKIIPAQNSDADTSNNDGGNSAVDNMLGALGGLGQAFNMGNADSKDKYVINVKQIAKFVVGLGERIAPTDIEEGMRCRPQQVPDPDPPAPQD